MSTLDLKFLHKLYRDSVLGRGRLSAHDRRRLKDVVRRLRAKVAIGDAVSMSALAFAIQELPGTSRRSKREAVGLIERAAHLGELGAKTEHALQFISSGKKRSGLRLLEQAASAGNSRAQCELGVAYLQGNGVPKSPSRAESLLRRAATAGNDRAALWLGWKRDFDEGKPAEAVKWYAKGARGGEVEAMVNYGVSLEKGVGVRQNRRAAKKWFQKAAAAGNPKARAGLRRLASNGGGTRDMR